ncbi:hypothetical protein [Streptomyces sp. MZ04]|uniref:hypothetical protein n=1 Tax=Streptomyces sp. MZ04 TaxID=2559236 RepID=UPI00107E88A3|nr:hypothetical protein [Streptomyces sp. MZ04]TGB05581.1 hypothetical protein E2651_24735 [Streptomyces sp. MZ04]
MSLFTKIKNLLTQLRPARTPEPARGDEAVATEAPATPAPSINHGGGDLGLKGAVARGAAEGTARESLRQIIEGLFKS